MPRMPFKYRITAVIFVLSATLLAIVVSQSLSQYYKGSHDQISQQRQTTLKLLGEFSRIALLTTDYESFQPQLEQISNTSGISNIVLANDEGVIVASNNHGWIGQYLSNKKLIAEEDWEVISLENISGKLGTLTARFTDDLLISTHNNVRSLALTLSISGLVIIALVSFLAGHLLTRRLSLITQTADAIAAGDLTARAEVQGRDEVSELGLVFDNMVHKIQHDHMKTQEREQYLSLTLDSIGDAVITTDFNGCVTRMNPVAEKLTGWSSSEANGCPLPDVFKIINAKSREVVSNPVDKALETKSIVELANHTVLINKNKTEYQIADSAAPIIDNNNNILGAILVFRDVTQQYLSDEALRRSQKMDAIGQLSGGIAHDFNNQLNIVIGYLDFLNNFFPETAEQSKWVKAATNATLRSIELTKQLLSFSRRASSDNSVLDINGLFPDLETMISRSVTPEINVQYSLAENLWLTDTNTGELQDVIINLVINARDAIPDTGKIRIETLNKNFCNDTKHPKFEIKDGEYVQLTVSDTGLGMNKKTQEHIFEPFFTTKAVGKGTGLGMSIIYGFVKRYDGYIDVYSEPGVGTTIRIYLPRSISTLKKIVTTKNKSIDYPTGNESILIVDDEINLLELAEHLISELGYSTYTADNATDALDILKNNSNIDLLFSDVVMPGSMNGYELAELVTRQYPSLKVLLTSGFTSRSISQNKLARFTGTLLSKPYRKIDLAQRVRDVLDEIIAP